MKKLAPMLAIVALTIQPVAATEARNYNVVDPAAKVEQTVTYASAPTVETKPPRGTDPTDQRWKKPKDPNKPAPEFWYLLAAGVASIVFFAVIDKGPNHGLPPAGSPTVNRP